MALTPAEIRRQILKKQNLHPKINGGLTYRMPRGGSKTTIMRYVEERFGQPIENLIYDGSLDQVAEKLDIDRTTVLRWRRKLAALVEVEVVNRRRNYTERPGDVYIGRPGPYGNPFVIGRDGNRDKVIELFEEWITTQPLLIDSLKKREPKRLVCWCDPLKCHGHTYRRLLKLVDPQGLDDFLAWKPTASISYIGSGLLYEQTRAVIYGRYKSYKSLVVARLALSLANGDPWLGFQTQETGITALYLQIELSHKMLQTRIKKMWPGGRPKVEPYLWTEHFIKLDTDAGLKQLDDVLTKVKPQVLIIDPVYKILSGNILEASSVQKLLDNLDIMIATHNCSVVLVSHTRKGTYEEWGSDDLLGSVYFSAWADTLIRLERSTTGLKATFEVVRHAEVELPSREFILDRDRLDFCYVPPTVSGVLVEGEKPQI